MKICGTVISECGIKALVNWVTCGKHVSNADCAKWRCFSESKNTFTHIFFQGKN